MTPEAVEIEADGASFPEELAPLAWTWHEALYAREAARAGRGLPRSEYEALARPGGGLGAAAPGLSVLQLTGRPPIFGDGGAPPIQAAIPSDVALASEAWKLHELRRLACRGPSAPLLYGVNGRQECRSRAPCGCRDCEDCAPYQEVTNAITAIDPAGLMTLTQKPEGDDWEAVELAWLRISEDWGAFRHWLDRHHLEIGRYVGVLEPHGSMMPHLHIVTEHFPTELAVWRTRKLKTGASVEVQRVERALYVAPLRTRTGRELAERPDAPSKTFRRDTALVRARLQDGWAHITGGAWKAEWEGLMKRGNGLYVAKYLTKLGELPEKLRAFLWANGVRMWFRGHGVRQEKPASCWKWYRGAPRDVEEAIRREAREKLEYVTKVDSSSEKV